MAEWLSWLHLPDISDTQFEKQKAAYVAEHGYTITIPGLSDIIKIPTIPAMTYDEHLAWKRKDWDAFGPMRLEELRKLKEKKRAKFLGMLASPQPQVIRAAGSIMTAIDDAQDGISTLAVLGQLARRVAPKAIEKLISGPVGVLTTVAEVLNLIQAIPQACLAPMQGKRVKDSMSRASPKQKLGKALNAGKVEAKLPGKGDLIQALQTTESIFGFGLSLGPVLGLAQDVASGAVRTVMGQDVSVKFPVPDFKHWFKAAQKVAKATSILWGYPYYTDDTEILEWIAAAHLAGEHINASIDQWNPFDAVEDLANAEVQALIPWHTMTLEIIQEEAIPIAEHVAWPQTGRLWESISRLADITHPIANQNLSDFVDRNRKNWTGFTGATMIAEGGMFMLSVLCGPENTTYQYKVSSTVATMFMAQSTRLDPNQPIEKFTAFIQYLEYLDMANHYPTYEEIVRFCRGPAQIKLLGATL